MGGLTEALARVRQNNPESLFAARYLLDGAQFSQDSTSVTEEIAEKAVEEARAAKNFKGHELVEAIAFEAETKKQKVKRERQKAKKDRLKIALKGQGSKYSSLLTMIAQNMDEEGLERTVVVKNSNRVVIGCRIPRKLARQISENEKALEGIYPQLVASAQMEQGDATYLFSQAQASPGVEGACSKTQNAKAAIAKDIVSKLGRLHGSRISIGEFDPSSLAIEGERAYFTQLAPIKFDVDATELVRELFYVLARLVEKGLAMLQHVGSLLFAYLQEGGPRSAVEDYFSDSANCERMSQQIYYSLHFHHRYAVKKQTFGDATLTSLVAKKVERYTRLFSVFGIGQASQH